MIKTEKWITNSSKKALIEKQAVFPIFTKRYSVAEKLFKQRTSGAAHGRISLSEMTVSSFSSGQGFDGFGGIDEEIFTKFALSELWETISTLGFMTVHEELAPTGSDLSKAMDSARGGYFPKFEAQAPPSAWYKPTSKKCNYECMTERYLYKGMVTNMGLNDENCSNSSDWKVCSTETFRQKDWRLFQLLTSQS